MKTLRLILITGITLSCVVIIPICFAENDNSDRLNQQSSYAFSPGYVNAARQQAENLLNVKIPDDQETGFFEKAVEYVKNKMGYKAAEQALMRQNPNPELQRKTGGANPVAAASVENQGADLSQYNIVIGTGTDQRDIDGNLVRESGKRMVSEVIGGIRHLYAGFDKVGVSAIGDAITQAAAGDKVIVKGGVYNLDILSIDKGIGLYGSYKEDGTRDIIGAATKIYGSFFIHDTSAAVEVNGFEMSAASELTIRTPGWEYVGKADIVVLNTPSAKISNNLFKSITGLLFGKTASTFVKDNIFSGAGGIMFSGQQGADVSIINNTFDIASYGYGIKASGLSVNVLIKENTFNMSGATSCAVSNTQTDIVSTGNNYNIYGKYGVAFSNPAYVVLSTGTIASSNDYFNDENHKAGEVMLNNGEVFTSPGISISNQSAYAYKYNNLLTQAAGGATQITPFVFDMRSASIYDGGLFDYGMYRNAFLSFKGPDYTALGLIFKGLLAKKEEMGGDGRLGPKQLDEVLGRSLSDVAFMMPANAQVSYENLEIARALTIILNNSTSGQKTVIDVVTGLINDMDNLKEQPGDNAALVEASSKLLKAVANVLIAQAVPDLLTESDSANIKNIFSELDTGKSRVLLEYNEETKPYYDEVKKLFSKNASALSDVLSKNVLEKELKEMPRSEIDKILEKLRAKSQRTFEEDYILQEVGKYREKYILPSKKKMESGIKAVLENATKRLSATLDSVKK